MTMPAKLPWRAEAGERHNRLVAIECVDKAKNGGWRWLFRCDCGTEKIIAMGLVRRGSTQSCGCVNRQMAKEMAAKLSLCHGMSNTPTYRSWAGMIQRCCNPKTKAFHNYGGRGIFVCDRWLTSFEVFLSDMGVRPDLAHSLDRKDVNGPYSPENCCWSNNKTQQRNRRNNVRANFRGADRCVSEIIELSGLPRAHVVRLIRQGKDVPDKYQPANSNQPARRA